MNIKTPIIAIMALIAASPVVALDQSLHLGSDYISDGISQTQSGVMLQWQANHQVKDFYFNALASNVEFSGEKGWEFDIGAGINFAVNNLKFDVGLLNNFNFGMDNQDDYFWELYTGLLLSNDMSVYFTYADDRRSFDGGKNAKISFAQTITLAQQWNFDYQVGYADMYRSRLSGSDYIWWQAGLSYEVNQYRVKFNYSDTDIKQANDFNDIAQQAFSASVAIQF